MTSTLQVWNKEDKVLALFSRIRYPEIHQESLKRLNEKGISIWYGYRKSKEIRNFGTVIISPFASRIITNDDSIFEHEIIRVLDDGGHVCILCDSECSTDTVISHILFATSITLFGLTIPMVEVNVKQSEFTLFLRNYAIVSNVIKSDGNIDSVICTMKYGLADATLQNTVAKVENQPVAGLTIKRDSGNGLLTLVPFHLDEGLRGEDLESAVLELSNALETHRKNLIFRPPSWSVDVRLDSEKKLEQDITKLRNEIELKDNLLIEVLDLKSILWSKHETLVQKCISLLDVMGIKTYQNDVGEEDFWIVNNDHLELAMCECKGKDNDLTRADINMLDTHREARKRKENFPAILLVNSFNKANTLKEKDMPIASNVIEHAVKNNILVLRTLDLFRLLDLYQRKTVTTKEILNKFTSFNGWMKVNTNISILKK